MRVDFTIFVISLCAAAAFAANVPQNRVICQPLSQDASDVAVLVHPVVIVHCR
jgi:hypothetical protein